MTRRPWRQRLALCVAWAFGLALFGGFVYLTWGPVSGWLHQVWYDFWGFLWPQLQPAVWFSNVIGGLAYAVLVGIFMFALYRPFRKFVLAPWGKKLATWHSEQLRTHLERHREIEHAHHEHERTKQREHVTAEHETTREKVDEVLTAVKRIETMLTEKPARTKAAAKKQPAGRVPAAKKAPAKKATTPRSKR